MAYEKHAIFFKNLNENEWKSWVRIYGTYFEHFDHAENSQRTGQSKMLQYWRGAGGGCGHIESGTTIVFSPPRVTSWMHWTWPEKWGDFSSEKPRKTVNRLRITYTTFTDANAAWFWARWKVWIIPSRWARTIVAGANACFGLGFRRT